jgi:hypothetical protein
MCRAGCAFALVVGESEVERDVGYAYYKYNSTIIGPVESLNPNNKRSGLTPPSIGANPPEPVVGKVRGRVSIFATEGARLAELSNSNGPQRGPFAYMQLIVAVWLAPPVATVTLMHGVQRNRKRRCCAGRPAQDTPS